MFCPQCGSENKDTSQFCTNCGSSLAAAAKVLEKVRADEAREAGEADSVAAGLDDAGAVDAQAAREDGEPATDETAEAEIVAEDVPVDDGSSELGESREVGESESQDDAESNAVDAPDGVAEAAEVDEPSDGEGRQNDTVATEADTPAGVTEPFTVLAAEDPAAGDASSAAEPTPVNGAPTTSATKPKDRRPLYIAGIAVGLVLIGILSYQLFFNRTGGDIVTYGQIEPVYIDADTTITPKGSDGKELDSYEVTLSNSEGTAAAARVKGSGGFSVKHLNKASKLKSGSYTVKIYDRTTKVEWTLPVKFAPKKKKASTAVTIEVADQSDASKKSDDTSSESNSTSNTVYALYYQKVQEYLATYGEPSIVSGTGSSGGIAGLAYARLVDFDNDGTDELYLIYCTKSKEDLASATPSAVGGYVSEVWAYRNGGIKQVHKNEETASVSVSDDGSCSAPLYKHGDYYALLESYMDGEYVGFAYKELKNDSFTTKKSYVITGNGIDAEILIDGRKVDDAALAELTGKFEGKCELLFKGGLYSVDGSLETTIEATQKVFAQLKSNMTSEAKKSTKTKASSSKASKAENKKAHAAYQEVFKQYREIFAAGADALSSDSAVGGNGSSTYWTNERQNAKYPLVAARAIVNKGIEADKMRYLYTDLNGDGVDELLVGYVADDSSVAGTALYAYVNGEVKGLLKSDTYMSSWLFLCEDGDVCWGGNSGWAMSEWHYCQFDGSKMNEVEELNESHGNGPSASTVITTYVKNGETEEYAEDDGSSASDQAGLPNSQALIEKVQAKHAQDTSVTWKKLPE